MTGLFVAFEGGEGAGKSTQAARLATALRAQGRTVVLTREPGATPVGARLRDLLLDRSTSDLSPRTEALLYAADRAQHVAEVIAPALARDDVVITDRFVASSLAYQGGGRDLSYDGVSGLSAFATAGLQPHRTVLLDIDPRTGLTRAGRVGAPDRLEDERIEFHDRVRRCFLDLAAAASESWLVLDAARDPDDLHQSILEWVMRT